MQWKGPGSGSGTGGTPTNINQSDQHSMFQTLLGLYRRFYTVIMAILSGKEQLTPKTTIKLVSTNDSPVSSSKDTTTSHSTVYNAGDKVENILIDVDELTTMLNRQNNGIIEQIQENRRIVADQLNIIKTNLSKLPRLDDDGGASALPQESSITPNIDLTTEEAPEIFQKVREKTPRRLSDIEESEAKRKATAVTAADAVAQIRMKTEI